MNARQSPRIREDLPMATATQPQQLDDVVLEGEGVTLRRLTEEDVDDVVAAASDPETQRWLPLPRPYSADDARWFIHTFAAEQHRSGDGLVRAVEVAGRLVGAIDLKKTDWRARTTEVGYWAAPWARGEGHTTRAVRMLATWAL